VAGVVDVNIGTFDTENIREHVADLRHDRAARVLHHDVIRLYCDDRVGPGFTRRLDKYALPCLLRVLEIRESASQAVDVFPNWSLNDQFFLTYPVDSTSSALVMEASVTPTTLRLSTFG